MFFGASLLVNGESYQAQLTPSCYYSQDALGDVVYAQLPDVGQEVRKTGQ